MRNAIFDVCNGTIFVRFKIFTMRNSIFEFLMVKKREIGYEKWFRGSTELREMEGDGFFYHDRKEISHLQW